MLCFALLSYVVFPFFFFFLGRFCFCLFVSFFLPFFVKGAGIGGGGEGGEIVITAAVCCCWCCCCCYTVVGGGGDFVCLVLSCPVLSCLSLFLIVYYFVFLLLLLLFCFVVCFLWDKEATDSADHCLTALPSHNDVAVVEIRLLLSDALVFFFSSKTLSWGFLSFSSFFNL